MREHPKSSCAFLKRGKCNCACTILLELEPRVVQLDGHNIQKRLPIRPKTPAEMYPLCVMDYR
jgi:hypothetical protein